MTRNSSILATIFILLGLVIYLWESPPALLRGSDSVPAPTSLQPYAIVSNAYSKHYDNDGALGYTFKASILKHYQGDASAGPEQATNYTEIDGPRITIFHAGEPWHVRAVHGKFSEQNRHLLLWEDVVVSRSINTDTQTTMKTAKLEIKPEEKTAYTEDAVKIISPAGEVNATGMIANFVEKHITLLSNVSGTHEPVM